MPQAEVVDWGFPVTVGDVVMMGRVPLSGSAVRRGRDDRDAVDAALETVGMADAANRQIGALSGGQRRRVFLARALAAQAGPLPARRAGHRRRRDDPGGPDAILEAESTAGRTVVATTHDLASAAHHFHQVAFVNGRIVAFGPADLVMDPALLTATYGGHVIVLPAGDRTIIDDAHHHDDAPAGERHFHDGAG